jgi:glutamate 5-kinase
VVRTDGAFEPGQVVDVAGPDGRVFARGIASTGAEALSAVLGRHTSALPEGMANTVIHRDDLVIVA